MISSSIYRLLVALLAFAVASAKESKPPETPGQDILATPVDAASYSSSSSKKSKKALLRSRLTQEPALTATAPPSLPKDMQRKTLRARTTLGNVDLNELSPAETVFFEDTWMAAYKLAHDADETVQDDINVRSVIIDDTAGKTEGKRNLWGSFSLVQRAGFFDVWSLLESTCYLCDNGNNDDDNGTYYSGSRSSSSGSVGAFGGGFRGLKMANNQDSRHNFENLLCEMLRDGDLEVFHNVQDCEVTIIG